MTERQIIERQEQSGNKELLLVLIGGFYHAFEAAAYALGRVTGYKVVRKHRKMGDIVTCGFAASQIEQVCQRLKEAGAELKQEDEHLWLFSGIDATTDESMIVVKPPRVKGRTMTIVSSQEPALNFPQADFGWLAEAVKSFNLSMSTPMDAMQFISVLQQEMRRRDTQ